MRHRIAILASGTNCSTLENLLIRELDGRISCIISNNPKSRSLHLAEKHSIPHYYVLRKNYDSKESFSKDIFGICNYNKICLICLAGWLPQLKVADSYKGRILNIHPSLLPKHGGKGMYGINVQKDVLASGDKICGATVHLVDDEYDHGSIIEQLSAPVFVTDTPESLMAHVQRLEKIVYPRAINKYIKTLECEHG